MADKLKIALALLLLVAGIAGFYLLAEQALVVRVLSVLLGVVAGIAVVWFTEPGQRFVVFGREAIVEAKKVVWPTRKETVQTTLVVFGFVVVMAVVLFLTDKTLEWVLYDLVLGWKKS
ncbi:preprotein translocase subunit SecE [Sulfuricystis multivorans]|uniref:preprotein translocase subunit SecE n=1 Tax=Sulfuricystis multivorans TaxID=2211108 RepID=UPI000F818ED7|nr:preprotein translocase subunit SecE [Sulfuricystis multivorans]